MAEKVVIGSAELWHGDCREVLPLLTADAVVTDPPYGYSYESNYTAETTTAAWMNTTIANDHDTSARDAVLTWADQRPWLAFGAWRMPKPAGVRGVLIWDKGPASGMGDLSFPWKGSWEEIYVGGKGWAGRRDEGVLKGHWVVTRASMGRTHPNEKPVSLMRDLMKRISPWEKSRQSGSLRKRFLGLNRRSITRLCRLALLDDLAGLAGGLGPLGVHGAHAFELAPVAGGPDLQPGGNGVRVVHVDDHGPALAGGLRACLTAS